MMGACEQRPKGEKSDQGDKAGGGELRRVDGEANSE